MCRFPSYITKTRCVFGQLSIALPFCDGFNSPTRPLHYSGAHNRKERGVERRKKAKSLCKLHVHKWLQRCTNLQNMPPPCGIKISFRHLVQPRENLRRDVPVLEEQTTSTLKTNLRRQRNLALKNLLFEHSHNGLNNVTTPTPMRTVSLIYSSTSYQKY